MIDHRGEPNIRSPASASPDQRTEIADFTHAFGPFHGPNHGCQIDENPLAGNTTAF